VPLSRPTVVIGGSDMIKNLTHFRKYIKDGVKFKVYGFFNGLDKINSDYDPVVGKTVIIKRHNRRGFVVADNDKEYWVPYPWGPGFKCEKRLNKTVVILFRPGHSSGKHLILELNDE
jgi:hypothetical protein